jgi:Phosphotransferase enzyme family
VNKEAILEAAEEFIGTDGHTEIEPLGNGLIHHTYKISNPALDKKAILQAINTHVFTRPSDVAGNYLEIYAYLQLHENGVMIPRPLPCRDGSILWVDSDHHHWRATAFVENSYSPMNAMNEDAAYTVAKSFAGFTRSLSGMDVKKLKETIPGFHNLSSRYVQFEEALQKAPVERLIKSTHIISELKQRRQLVEFYENIQNSPDYPDRAMHHDCKISNILFDIGSDQVICPVDLDTTMPGKYFSDIGDMIRTMTCTIDENSVQWEELSIRPAFYEAILKGYLEEAGDIFTKPEKKDIHYSGLLLTYMQTLRFISDFLNGDIYYKTTYPEQNLNRSLNQLLLLEKLEEYLHSSYNFDPYQES